MENILPELFRTAFERGDSIDYKSNSCPNDHSYIQSLGYKPEMHSDCSFSAKGLKGISLSSYGDWGTAFANWMDAASKKIFLDMYDKKIIELWRITVYKDGASYKYEVGEGWIKYSDEVRKWIRCDSPYDK